MESLQDWRCVDAQGEGGWVVGFEELEGSAELVNRYEDARLRAKALDSKHDLDGSPSGSSPSSGACQLVDQIRRPD